MRMTHLRFVVASCVLCLLPISASAQTSQPGQATQQSAQQRDQASQQRLQTQQRDQDGQQRGQAQQRGQDGQQRSQAQQRGQDGQQRGQLGRGAAQQGENSTEDFLVQRLILANKAEIELSQMATEKANDEKVKQFAQKLVKDHQELKQELERFGSGQRDSAQTRPGQRQPGQTQSGQIQRGQDQLGQTQPGQTQPGQTQPDQTQLGQTQPGQTQRGQAQLGQTQRGQAGMRRTGEGQEVPQQLTQIVEQAAQKHLQMAKEMLQEAEGEEFDMAFVGMQIVKHGMMVAELEAMRNVGSQEFQQLVSKAESKTSEHLKEAKQLAKQLKDGRPASSQGRQPSSPDAQRGAQPSRSGAQGGTRGSN